MKLDGFADLKLLWSADFVCDCRHDVDVVEDVAFGGDEVLRNGGVRGGFVAEDLVGDGLEVCGSVMEGVGPW